MAIETTSLSTLFDRALARFANRVAIEYRGRDLTYKALGAYSTHVAEFLAHGRGKDPIALLLPNTPTHPVVFFAAARLGVPVVHVSPLDGMRVLEHKLADSGARTLVTTNVQGLAARARSILESGWTGDVLVVDDEIWGTPRVEAPAIVKGHRLAELQVTPAGGDARSFAEVPSEHPALIQYTGGTTGLPKGAVLSHRNLTAAVSMYGRWNEGQGVAWPDVERIICVLPLFHIFALSTILLRGLSVGAQILLRPRFDVAATLDDVEVRRATGLPGVPTMWIAIARELERRPRDLSSLALVSAGGAPLAEELVDRLRALTGLTLRNGWGMTETAPAGTNNPRHIAPKPGSIGVPLPGIEMDVVALGDTRRVLPAGEVGELRIRGPNVTAGYHNRPDATAAAFVDDWFLTGDIGRMDEDGYFFLLDRRSDMIISGGFNVYPQLIEQAIYEHPSVEEVLVIGVPDAYRGESAKAFVKLRTDAQTFDLEALVAFLRPRLGAHEMPRGLEIRGSLPRTPVGKLSKAELKREENGR